MNLIKNSKQKWQSIFAWFYDLPRALCKGQGSGAECPGKSRVQGHGTAVTTETNGMVSPAAYSRWMKRVGNLYNECQIQIDC